MQLKEVEKKVITLVESRGVAAFPYRKNISNIIEYINKEFSNGNTEFTIVGDSGIWLCDVFKFSDENYTYLSFLTSTSQLDNIQIISLGEDIEIAQGSIENFLLICDTANVNTNYEFHDGIKSLYTVHVIERCNKPELWFKFRGNTGVCIVTKRMLEDILTILYKK